MIGLKTIKPLVPPVLTSLARRWARPGLEFKGSFDSWEAASAHASGYDVREITERLVSATRKVVAGEAAYERDTVVFDHIEYSWPLLASLLQVAAERGSLRIVDFGGSLGSSWRQNKRYLQRLRVPLAWHVVEQAHLVELGRAEFSDEVLRFHHGIPQAAQGGADAVLFLSSLCYVREPAHFLREAAATPAQFIIIDRLPTIAGRQDRISVQYVSEPIYPASYPIRLFARDSLLSGLLKQWRLIESWDCDLQPDPVARYRGYFLERS
jgi:putative methyltransferase (TIGR04325 family)